jgi:hypothetical protein
MSFPVRRKGHYKIKDFCCPKQFESDPGAKRPGC